MRSDCSSACDEMSIRCTRPRPARRLQRFGENHDLLAAAAAQLDDQRHRVLERAEPRDDLGRVPMEQRALRARDAVPRQPADRLEEARAERVVEILRLQLLRREREIARDVGGALHQRVIVGEIGEPARPRAALVLRRLIAVGPPGDVGGAFLQLAAARKIHVGAGRADDEIGCERALWRPQLDAASRFGGGFDRRALMKMKIGVTPAAIVGRLRKSFPHLEDGAHETPAPGILEIAEMTQEAAKGQPDIGLDQLDLGSAAKQMHLGRTGFQRGRGIVERGSAGADHRNLLAAQAREINGLRGMHAKRRRQMAQRFRNDPVAHAFLPRRQHDLARKQRIDAGRSPSPWRRAIRPPPARYR